MSLNVKSTVRLANDRYEYDSSASLPGPAVILHSVHYGYVTSGEELDAVVVLGYHTGGTAHLDYVYILRLGTGRPELAAWFEAGTRSDSGLYRV